MPEMTLTGHLSTGHDACPPVPAAEGSPAVHAAHRAVVRVGDPFQPHGCPVHQVHQGLVREGAPHVTINGRNVARRGDPIDCKAATDHIAEGLATVRVGDFGGEDYGRELIFAMLTDPMDLLILCLEEIAAAEYSRANELDRQGWAYFQSFMPKWLGKKGYAIQNKYDNGGQEPAFVDWNWLLKFPRFFEQYLVLQQREYLFTPAARASLAGILEKEGAFRGSGAVFDHIALSWDQLRSHAFQGKPMSLPGWSSDDITMPDGLQATVANVTILAVAAGYTTVQPDGARRVHVQRAAFFIHDGFDFQGEQWLGNWDCPGKRFSLWHGKKLTNRDFRHFREHTGYGCDFRIMSHPEVVWRGDYAYDVL